MRNMLLALALASASLTVGNIGSAASADLPSQGMQTPSNSMTTGMMESCGRMMSQMMNVAPQQPDRTAAASGLAVRAEMRKGPIIGAVIVLGAVVAAVLYQQGRWSSTEGPVATLPEPTAGSTFAWLNEPRPMPPLHFVDGGGRAGTLAEFHGRTILLNIWATWCAPCRHEMPTLDRLQAKLGSRDFEVVTLSVDRGGIAAVQAFFREINVQALRIYVDPSSDATGALGLSGLPTTLLVDPAGREIGRRIGPANWDSPEMVQAIRAHLVAR